MPKGIACILKVLHLHTHTHTSWHLAASPKELPMFLSTLLLSMASNYQSQSFSLSPLPYSHTQDRQEKAEATFEYEAVKRRRTGTNRNSQGLSQQLIIFYPEAWFCLVLHSMKTGDIPMRTFRALRGFLGLSTNHLVALHICQHLPACLFC